MIPWVQRGQTTVPGDRQELTLWQRGDEFSIRLSGHVGELMNSRRHTSEETLARLACEGLGERPAARVLIGGLGMGYTLAGALRELGPDASVVVAELVGAVVDWNRGPLGPCAGRPLDDARVQVSVGDVVWWLSPDAGTFDAVVLDVDNGPSAMTRRPNAWLYGRAGLSAARDRLRPGGVLAVWSAEPDDAFTGRLEQAGFRVRVETTRARPGKGARHVVWLGRRGPDR